MNIKDLSLNLQKTYEEMTLTFNEFQAKTKLSCLEGCGKCCTNPEIEASVLEMLPLALKVMEEGKLEEWLERAEGEANSSCMLFQGNKESGIGKCTDYNERPSLCRMFGAAGYYNKNHEVSLSICKIIRETHPHESEETLKILNKKDVPMLSEWATLARSLGEDSINVRMPINLAIKGALEKTALYAQYNTLL